MKNKLFDDFFKQQMLHIDGEVSDDVWNKIQAKKENKKRFGFWFLNMTKRNFIFWGLFAFSIGGGSILFSNHFFQNKSNSNNIHTKNEIVVNTIQSQNASPKIQPVEPKNNDDVVENNLTESKSNNDVSKKTVQITSTNNNSNVNKKVTSSINAIDANSDFSLNKKGNKQAKNNLIPSIYYSEDLVSINNKKNKNKILNAHKNIHIQSAETDEMLDESDVYLKKNLDFQVELLKHSNLNSLKLNTKPLPKLTIPCPDFNNNENTSYLDFYSSVDFINRQFSDSTNSIYLKNRNEVTKSQLSFSAGLRYVKEFGSRFNFSAGLNYSQINEQFKFSKGNIIQIIYVTNASGDTVDIYQTESTRYKTTYNKYRTIDLPISIGYGWKKNNWDFVANAGVVMNIISFYKGDILNSDLQPIAMNASSLSKAYQLKTNIGLGCIGSLSIVHPINNTFSVFTEPYFRYNFSLMNKETNHFKQRFTTTGLRLGIRMNLKNKNQ
jgi:hypothetical protein